MADAETRAICDILTAACAGDVERVCALIRQLPAEALQRPLVGTGYEGRYLIPWQNDPRSIIHDLRLQMQRLDAIRAHSKRVAGKWERSLTYAGSPRSGAAPEELAAAGYHVRRAMKPPDSTERP